MTWTTADDGTITIDGDTPMLSGQALAILKDRVVGRWLDAAREAVDAPGASEVRVEDLLSIVYAETQGNEKAVSPDGGWGLGQLTSASARGGLSEEELLDGPTNLKATARFMSRIGAATLDLPRLGATYNAGSARPSTANRWGLVSSPGYLDRVVGARNTIIALGLTGGSSNGGPTKSIGERIASAFVKVLALVGLTYAAVQLGKR